MAVWLQIDPSITTGKAARQQEQVRQMLTDLGIDVQIDEISSNWRRGDETPQLYTEDERNLTGGDCIRYLRGLKKAHASL